MELPPMTKAAQVAYAKEPKRSALIPATSPTLSPTLSAMVAGFFGLSSGSDGLEDIFEIVVLGGGVVYFHKVLVEENEKEEHDHGSRDKCESHDAAGAEGSFKCESQTLFGLEGGPEVGIGGNLHAKGAAEHGGGCTHEEGSRGVVIL
ncbi:unnamed protein product [Sphagnum balticum]